MNFVAIDFETATAERKSACAVAIITVEEGQIVDAYHQFIQPPNNEYSWRNTQVHGMTSRDTRNSPNFAQILPEIQKRLAGQTVVAHNESFDRSVLTRTLEHYGHDYASLNLAARWQCTMKIYKAKGFKPAKLNVLCDHFSIELKHHEALSDAKACAELFLRANQ